MIPHVTPRRPVFVSDAYDRLIELRRQLQELRVHQKFLQVFFPTLCELTPRVDPRSVIEGRGPASAVSTQLDDVTLSARFTTNYHRG